MAIQDAKRDQKRVRTYAIVAVLLAVILGVLVYNLGFIPEIPLTQASFLKTFSSDAELKSYLTANSKSQSAYTPYYGSLNGIRTWVPDIPIGVNGFVFAAMPAGARALHSFRNARLIRCKPWILDHKHPSCRG